MTSSALKESDPVPVHVPLSEPGAGVGGTGVGFDGGVTTGLGAVGAAEDIDPHAASHEAIAPSSNTWVVLILVRPSLLAPSLRPGARGL